MWFCYFFVSVGLSCKVVHLAGSTPPDVMASAMQMYDNDGHRALTECTAVDAFGEAWQQAQLSLNRGSLGLCSLVQHCAAAYISSVRESGQCAVSTSHFLLSINLYNSSISPNKPELICCFLLPCVCLAFSSPSSGLHMDPSELQVALQWWLGTDLAHGHYAITCKHGGENVVTCHNRLCDVFAESCRHAHVTTQVEVGSDFGHDSHSTRPVS